MHMYASAKRSALAEGFRQIRPGLLAAGGLSVFINLLVFVSPLYTMQIYDRVLTSRNAMTLLLLSLIALALFVSYAALEHFRSRVLVQTGIRFDHLLSGEAFETALGRSLSTSSSHHVQLLRDVDTLREVLSGGVITSLMDVPWTPIFLGMCFLLHPLIGLVALIGALIILALALVNERITKAPLIAASFKNLHALDRLTSSLRNAEAIRALGMGPAVRGAWAETHGQALVESARAGERGGTLLAISKKDGTSGGHHGRGSLSRDPAGDIGGRSVRRLIDHGACACTGRGGCRAVESARLGANIVCPPRRGPWNADEREATDAIAGPVRRNLCRSLDRHRTGIEAAGGCRGHIPARTW